MNPRTQALLASARIANLPSVCSEVLLGMLWVGAFMGTPNEFWFTWASLSTAGVLLCLAGNLINDWHDHRWDAQHRPERAIPAGLISRRTYLILACLSVAAGLVLAFAVARSSGLVAMVILACIAIYTVWHKCSGWAILPLALCRALLPVMALAPWLTQLSWRPALACAAIAAYLMGLSIEARHEASVAQAAGRWVKLPWLGVGLMAISIAGLTPLLAVAAALLAPCTWLVFLSRKALIKRARVSGLLAALPLLDAIAIWPLALWMPLPWQHALGAALVPALSFTAALRLQRVASAT